MTKVVLYDIVNLQNETTATNRMNDNSARIEAALNNAVSRDGTSPNAMLANLDMNSHRILNLPQATVTGEPLVFGEDVEVPTFIVQDSEPATTFVEGSLWVDSNSTNQDLYQLTSGAWVDTTVNIKGDQGIQGPAGQDGTIAGDTGATDNAVLTADGVGGATLQATDVVIDDSDNITGVNDLTIGGDLSATGSITGSNLNGTAAVLAGGQTLTGGFAGTSDNDGTKSTGTYTPVFTEGNLKRIVNGGAFTLGVPTGEGTMVIQVTNNASAGAVTTSGYTKVTGDTLTTTDGHDFLLFITVINSFSHLHKQALQ